MSRNYVEDSLVHPPIAISESGLTLKQTDLLRQIASLKGLTAVQGVSAASSIAKQDFDNLKDLAASPASPDGRAVAE